VNPSTICLPERSATNPEARTLSVALINPKFEPSMSGHDFILPLLGGDRRCWMVTNALPALAALTPESFAVTLFDENVRPLDYEDLRRFDVIGITGMIVQRMRMREILLRLKALPAMVVVGGPYVSVDEAAFEGLCDVRFIGEAEETWPAFLTALALGQPIQDRYQQSEKTDMTKVPAPRYDLVDCDRYVLATLQFSRGCPFLCEFCDIITLFGRRPRLKSAEQVLDELEAIRQAGFKACFVVDDNFIGNKVAAKKLLHLVIDWQRKHGFPLQLSTEASINLADDPELIKLMVRANFRQVFIGIESPRAASLNETRKVQNTRGDGLLDKVVRIRDGGLVIVAGFIVGFDNDDLTIFDEQARFIGESGIGQAYIAILTPIPTTPLYDRLKAEGRLDYSDPEVAFIPRQMTPKQLREGRTQLIRGLYTAEAYLDRIFHGYRSSPSFRRQRAQLDAEIGRKPNVSGVVVNTIGSLLQLTRLGRRLVQNGLFWRLAPQYLSIYLRKNLPLGKEAIPFAQYVGLLMSHWHFYNTVWNGGKEEIGIAGVPLGAPVQSSAHE
jgi:radical SAM superfamily enzyme YgiQ (UPF0313 family)